VKVLTVALTAAGVPVSSRLGQHGKSGINLSIVKSQGLISVENIGIKKTHSIHKFILQCDNEILREFCNLPKEHQTEEFLISLSLSNPHALFSPIEVYYLNSAFKKEIKIRSSLRFTGSAESEYIININMKEDDVLNTIGKLLSFGIFDFPGRLLWEQNVIESIGKYWEACKAGDISDRYDRLYIALEKAVDVDGEDRNSSEFDERAFEITGLEESEITNLRNLMNREKHIQKGESNIEKHEELLQKLHSLIAQLKIATDRAILYRLKRGKLL